MISTADIMMSLRSSPRQVTTLRLRSADDAGVVELVMETGGSLPGRRGPMHHLKSLRRVDSDTHPDTSSTEFVRRMLDLGGDLVFKASDASHRRLYGRMTRRPLNRLGRQWCVVLGGPVDGDS